MAATPGKFCPMDGYDLVNGIPQVSGARSEREAMAGGGILDFSRDLMRKVSNLSSNYQIN
jgi:hypothetical protein